MQIKKRLEKHGSIQWVAPLIAATLSIAKTLIQLAICWRINMPGLFPGCSDPMAFKTTVDNGYICGHNDKILRPVKWSTQHGNGGVKKRHIKGQGG